MRVTVKGQDLDYYDHDGIRAAATSHAIKMIRMLKGPRLRREFENFFSNIYVLFIKAGGVMAVHELLKHEQMPVDEYREVLNYLRAVLGEPKPTASMTMAEYTPLVEVVDGYRERDRGEVGDSGERSAGAETGTVGGGDAGAGGVQAAGGSADNAALDGVDFSRSSAVDGH